MTRRWALLLLLLALALALLGVARAGAQQCGALPCSVVSTTTTTLPAGVTAVVPASPVSPDSVERSVDDLDPNAPTGLIPDNQYPGGALYPTAHYDLGWDPGEPGKIGWGPFKVKVGFAFSPVGLATAGIFAVNNAALNVAFRLSRSVLNFHIVDVLAGPADAIGKALSASLLGGWLQVRYLIIMVTGIICLRKARDGVAVAGQAALTSVLYLVLAGALLISPGNVFRTGAEFSRQVSILVMDSVAQRAPQPGEELGDSYYGALQQTLVQQPYYRLNWGQVPTGVCYDTVKGILRDGPWGDSDEPRKRMVAAGCPNMAEYNANASWSRLGGAAAMIFVVHPIAWGLILFSVVVMVSLVGLAVTCAVGPIALTLAAPPGKMRGIAAVWVGSYVGRALKVVVFTAITGGFLAAVGALAAAPNDQVSGGARWMYLVGIVVAFGVLLWKARNLQTFITNMIRPNVESRPVGKVVVHTAHAAGSTRDAVKIAAGVPQSVNGRPVANPLTPRQAATRAASSWARNAAGVDFKPRPRT